MRAAAVPQWAAVAVMAAAVGLALAQRGFAPRGGEPWAAAVESGADHISVAEFGARVLADRGDTVVVDLRARADVDAFPLAVAVPMDLPTLLGPQGEALLARSREQLVVLVSTGMTHPGQAWVELWRRGYRNVRVLEGGLTQLQAEVLTPPSLRGPTTAARAQAEAPAFAAAMARFLARPPAQAPQSRAASRPASRAAGRSEFAADPAQLATPTVVSTQWVEQRGSAVVVLDARESAEDYAKGHLPGARHLPPGRLRHKRDGLDDLLPAAELARVFGGAGLAADTEVVVYAGDKLQDATLVILALVSVGHDAVALMDGGVGAWRTEGRPIVAEVPVPGPREYAIRPRATFAMPLAAMIEAWRNGKPAILDVRPGDGFRGEKSTEARPGHIPGSLHRPYTADVTTRDGGTFLRPRAELLADYARMGLVQQPVVVTCRTGHQASQTWFLLRHLLGNQDARWFDGSWQEWAARSDLPAETGEPRH